MLSYHNDEETKNIYIKRMLEHMDSCDHRHLKREMLSYHNDQSIKNKYVKRMRDHIAADELVRGVCYVNGRGCAIGCTLNGYDHDQYPIELGIPVWLGEVEEVIFENMSEEKSKKFPLEFLKSIKIGVDLEQIKSPFLIYILELCLNALDRDEFLDHHKMVCDVIEALRSGNSDRIDIGELGRMYRAHYGAVSDIIYIAFCAAKGQVKIALIEYMDSRLYLVSKVHVNHIFRYDHYADKLLQLLKECK